MEKPYGPVLKKLMARDMENKKISTEQSPPASDGSAEVVESDTREQRGKIYQEERILLTKYGEWDGETGSTGDGSKVEGPGFELTDGTITDRTATHVAMAAEALGAKTKDYQTLLAFMTQTGAIRMPSPTYGAAAGPLNLHVEARPTADQMRLIDAHAKRATQIVVDYRNQSKTFALWGDAMRFFQTLPESTHAENGQARS